MCDSGESTCFAAALEERQKNLDRSRDLVGLTTMPSVFSLNGANSTYSPSMTVNFPEAGSPLAPHAAIVGPTRVATPVFGPGGTPIMYRRRYPARGPVCDYCDPDYFTVMDGGQTVIPYKEAKSSGFGGVSQFLARQSPAVATTTVIGGSLLTAGLLGGFGAWLYYRIAYKPKRSF